MEVKHSIAVPTVKISPNEFHEKVFGTIANGIYLGQTSCQDIIDHKPVHCTIKNIYLYDELYMYLATIEVPDEYVDKYNELKEKYGLDLRLHPVYCSPDNTPGQPDWNKYWICCWILNGPNPDAPLEGGGSNE